MSERIDALSTLTQWALDPDGAPCMVLAGSAGMGKTTTAGAAVREMLGRRKAGQAVPVPIFLRLERVAGITTADKTLPEIIALVLTHSGNVLDPSPLTAGEVLRLLGEGAVLILDGLELLLMGGQGAMIKRELERLLRYRGLGKLLVTVRPEIFRTSHEMEDFFDFEVPVRRLFLMPFTKAQSEHVLGVALGMPPSGVEVRASDV